MSITMTLNGPNVLIPTRTRIVAQNMLETDEFLMRGEPSLFVKSIKRNPTKGTVKVSFDCGEVRTFDWNQKVSIKTKSAHRENFRRNTLRKQGYPNYLTYSA